jgi:acyl-coenzyme A thioesterase PaaI-like protein
MPHVMRVPNPSTIHVIVQLIRSLLQGMAELDGKIAEAAAGHPDFLGLLRSGPQHANPMGTLHGGVLCDLADAAMGMAFASTLAPGESFTTMALESISFALSGKRVWR